MEKTIPTTKNGLAMYVIVQDGNNQEHKIVNFENPEMVPTEGIKIVRAIRKLSRHQPASVMKVARDRITGIIYGIPAGLYDGTKNLKFQSIEINDVRQFDLRIMADRMEWAVISRATYLVGSPNQKGKPTHTVYDVEAESNAKIINVSEKKQSYTTMEALSPMQVMDMARNCGGISVINNSLATVTAELYEFIDSKDLGKGAKKFNEIWTMTNREAMTIYNRCKSVGLVSFDINSGFLWKMATVLGTTDPQAIDYISNNPALLMAMDSESRSMDPNFMANASEEEKKIFITANPIPKEVDGAILAEMNKAMNRLSEKEAKLDELLAKMQPKDTIDLNAKAEVNPDAILNAGTGSEISAGSLREMQNRARLTFGMKHAYTIKDPKKIQDWMDTHPVVNN